MQSENMGKTSIDARLVVIRKIAKEAFLEGLISPATYVRIREIRGDTVTGHKQGRWLTIEEVQSLINAPDTSHLRGLRDRAVLGLIVGAGLRRQESVTITIDQIIKVEGRWVIMNLIGKGRKLRSIPIAGWTKDLLDMYTTKAGLMSGILFRPIRGRQTLDQGMGVANIWFIVQKYAKRVGIKKLRPHDLRRSYARLAQKGGADLDQIRINLGHADLKTTQIYYYKLCAVGVGQCAGHGLSCPCRDH